MLGIVKVQSSFITNNFSFLFIFIVIVIVIVVDVVDVVVDDLENSTFLHTK